MRSSGAEWRLEDYKEQGIKGECNVLVYGFMVHGTGLGIKMK